MNGLEKIYAGHLKFSLSSHPADAELLFPFWINHVRAEIEYETFKRVRTLKKRLGRLVLLVEQSSGSSLMHKGMRIIKGKTREWDDVPAIIHI